MDGPSLVLPSIGAACLMTWTIAHMVPSRHLDGRALNRWHAFYSTQERVIRISPIGPYVFPLLTSAGKISSGRLLFIRSATLLMLNAEGTERVRLLTRSSGYIGFIGSILLYVFLLYQPVATAYANFESPSRGENIKPMI